MKKKTFFIIIFFGCLITSILSPLASNEYLRNDFNADIVNHTAGIVQAKMALDEGQFPIRTAPWQNNNLGNPWFQFYSSVFYTTAGIVHKFFVPQNPYIALKIVLWFSLFLGTIYFYRLIFWLTKSNIIAVFSATVYVMSPYLLLNIFGRGAITEAVAQGILPIVLYYSLKIYFSPKFNLIYIIFAGIAWFALFGTHLITFFYLSLFLALFLLLFTVFNYNLLKNIIFVGIAYIYGLFLGFYLLIPIGLMSNYFSKILGSIFLPNYLFLTPLSTVLSIAPTSPMPLPGNGLLPIEQKVYLSLGLPMLLAIVGIIYILLVPAVKLRDDKCLNHANFLNRKFKIGSIILLVLFFIVLFIVWTPFNFWPHIPLVLQIGQFTYRLLAQTMWVGTILFAIALLALLRNKLDLRHAIVGFMLICLCTRPWITTQDVGKSIHVQDIIKNPDVGYGQTVYLIHSSVIPEQEDPIDISVIDILPKCTHEGKNTVCDISIDPNGTLQLPIFYYPKMLNIKANGKTISYFPTKFPPTDMTLVGIELPEGNYKIESYFQGIGWANWVSGIAWGLLIPLLLLAAFI